MRILTILMMIAASGLTAKAGDQPSPEQQIVLSAGVLLRAAIVCPSDRSPERTAAKALLVDALELTGRSARQARDDADTLDARLAKEGRLDEGFEFDLCAGLAGKIAEDLPARIEGFASR